MQHFTGREDWIRRRKNLATGLNSREISEEMSAKIRAQSFFSARVEQETQRTFFKRFEVDGRTGNMMVTVTSDGKCRSYMAGKDNYTDKARKGLNRVYKK